MKKTVLTICSVLLFPISDSHAQTEKWAKTVLSAQEIFPEVSRINLRAMQTRKFKKSKNEVFSAIETLCKDRDGNFSRNDFACIRPTSMGGGEFSISDKPNIYKYAVVRYELAESPESKEETIVRMRISWSTERYTGSEYESRQTTDVRYYNGNFKDLADGLFIDAIPLNPIEMQ